MERFVRRWPWRWRLSPRRSDFDMASSNSRLYVWSKNYYIEWWIMGPKKTLLNCACSFRPFVARRIKKLSAAIANVSGANCDILPLKILAYFDLFNIIELICFERGICLFIWDCWDRELFYNDFVDHTSTSKYTNICPPAPNKNWKITRHACAYRMTRNKMTKKQISEFLQKLKKCLQWTFKIVAQIMKCWYKKIFFSVSYINCDLAILGHFFLSHSAHATQSH